MYSTIIFILLMFPSMVFGGALQDAAFKVADHDSTYVIEKTNKNDHNRIDEYCKNVGIPRYSPYCAAGTYTWYKDGAASIGAKNPLYRTGSSGEIFRNALANPMRFKIIKPSQVRKGVEKIKLGDIVLWSDSPAFIHGHTGMILKQVTNTKFHSVEPNTSGSNALSEQREQTSKSKNRGGVYKKEREISDNPKFQTRAFVRPRVN